MEAFYEGEEKGEDDRKEKGKKVKPWGGFFFCSYSDKLYGCIVEEITYYIL